MIWIDFSIICVGQRELSKPNNMNNIIVDAFPRNIDSNPFYSEDYNFNSADKLLGYWYNVWLPEPICFEESFFDISKKDVPWVNVVYKWEKTVQEILEFYINESPEHKIAVLLRVQDDSNDVVHPLCKLDDFVNNLKEGNIKWNELYYVTL